MRVLAVLTALALGACQSPRLIPAASPHGDLGLAPALTAPPAPPSVEVLEASRPAPILHTTTERVTVRPGVRIPRRRATPVACAPRIDLPCLGGT